MRLKAIKSRKAFTLVEITITIGIVILLSALSIHNIIRARINSNEAAALRNLKTLYSVFASYRTVNPTYPEALDILAAEEPPYINNDLSDGEHQGYDFKVLEVDRNTFRLAAIPVSKGVTGTRSFVIDESGEIQEVASGGTTGGDTPYSPITTTISAVGGTSPATRGTMPAGTPNI